jgi:hypothetical protein
VSPHQFKQVDQFLHFIYKTNLAQENWQAGLYVQNNAEIKRIAENFANTNVNIGITQKIFTFIKTQVKSRTVLYEFGSIVDSLPAWNSNDPSVVSLYDMLIQFYGTDVSLSTEHGGTIYQQTTVKECYGGDVNSGMKTDLENSINKQNPTSEFARFRQLGQLNILGGNPELGSDRINERINSFEVAPAPVKFSTIPIWELIGDAQRKNWVKSAIERYIQKNQPNVASLLNQINASRLNKFKGTQNVLTMDVQREQQGVIIAHWSRCPVARPKGSDYTPFCAAINAPVTLAAGQRSAIPANYGNSPSIVERDANTGAARMINMEGAAVKFVSAWVTKGCTEVRYGPKLCVKKKGSWFRKKTFCVEASTVLTRLVCMDCVPFVRRGTMGKFNLQNTHPECQCQGF